MSPAVPRTPATRQRLLETAGEVFADQGFRSATVQEICRRAGANIAAVHYHFSSKEQLYLAVVEYADMCAMEGHPLDLGPSDTPPEARLRAFVEWFMFRLLNPGRPAWMGKLMAREMVEPTPALDTIVREKILANHMILRGIVRELVGSGPSDDDVRRCVLSIVGQCVFYRHSQPIILRLYPDVTVDETSVGAIADHIVRFSLAGIGAIATDRRGGRS